GIPIYVCASEATPLAAALVIKGLNPGAALVFLLAGPATNVGSIVVLWRFLGARILAIYLGSIVGVALLAGFALNWVYRAGGGKPAAVFGRATALVPEPAKFGSALLLSALLLLSMRRAGVPVEWRWLGERCAALTGVRLAARGIALASIAMVVVAYVASGL